MSPVKAIRCQATFKLQTQAAAAAACAWARGAAQCCGKGSRSIPSSTALVSTDISRCTSILLLGRVRRSSTETPARHRCNFRVNTVGCVSANIMQSSAGLTSTAGSSTTSTEAIAGAPCAAASSLWDDIVAVYDRAQTSGACSKTDTQVEVLHDPSLGVDFVLRVATALKAKPLGPPPAGSRPPAASAEKAPAAWHNPFLPPEPELFVRHLGPEHSVVLNKFNVVQHHVLLISREFRSQAEPLYGSDLMSALEVLRAMPRGGVAFYNCGPNSGRSQPHKHLQVVPLPFTEGQPPLAPVHMLVEESATAAAARMLQPLQLRGLPYKCYAALIPESPTREQLESAFNGLLHLSFPGYSYEPSPLLWEGVPRDVATAAAVAAGSVSYNVLLTQQWVMVVPRRSERCGPLALNSLAFGGTMLVRSEDELEFVRRTGPANILAQIGEPL